MNKTFFYYRELYPDIVSPNSDIDAITQLESIISDFPLDTFKYDVNCSEHRKDHEFFLWALVNKHTGTGDFNINIVQYPILSLLLLPTANIVFEDNPIINKCIDLVCSTGNISPFWERLLYKCHIKPSFIFKHYNHIDNLHILIHNRKPITIETIKNPVIQTMIMLSQV